MVKINKLFLENRGRGKSTHAEMISVTSPRPRGTFLHTQDYYEFMYVISGTATHFINGSALPIEAGNLAFVRPRDRHDIETTSEQSIQFYNIELSSSLWRAFCEITQINPEAPGAIESEFGSMVQVPEEHRAACLTVFRDGLHISERTPEPLDLHRFLCNVLWHLRQLENRPEITAVHHMQPVWLTNACSAMHDWQNLSGGLSRFIELSGVTVQHLSRVLKASTGQSPTEYINALRLKRAATLLRGTDLTISEIALDCGFQNLPYFYKIFQQKYGATPRGFRLRRSQFIEAETIAPSHC